MDLVELTCKRCGAAIQQEDVNLDLAIARCAHCGTMFSLKGQAQPPAVRQAVSQAPRPQVAMPPGVTVQDTPMGLQITYRWFNLSYVFLIFFTVFWNGFMIFWHGMSIASGQYMMSVFGLLHTAIGIFLGYTTLAGLINRTTILADMEWLTIRHGPLPWPGNQQVPVYAVEQIYCKEKISRSRNGTQYSYELHTVIEGEGQKKLMGKLKSPAQALYIEQELERYLGIQDAPVPGEYPR